MPPRERNGPQGREGNAQEGGKGVPRAGQGSGCQGQELPLTEPSLGEPCVEQPLITAKGFN